MAEDRFSLNNPYIVGSPVSGREMFFGREDVFEWIRLNLVGQHHDQPLVIAGQRRTGKTSVLKQIENGRLGGRYLAVFIDLQGFYIENSAGFLWELSTAASISLINQDIEPPTLDKSQFLAAPYQAFQEQFLQPILRRAPDVRMLFLFDETELLEDRFRSGRLDRSTFDFLRGVAQNTNQINFIFGLAGKLETFSQESIRLFNIALYKRISYLSHTAALRLIREPVPYEMSTEMSEAIVALTNGHPYYTQLVCHALFERWQTADLDTVTPDDVEAIIDTVLEQATAALTYVWTYENVTSDERLVMSALAAAAQPNEPASVTRAARLLRDQGVNLSGRSITTALGGLIEREVISGLAEPQFQVDLVRRWLRREWPVEWAVANVQKSSQLADQYANAGQILLTRGDRPAARSEYERALNEDPTHMRSILALGELALLREAWIDAVRMFEKGLTVDEENEVAVNGLVRARLGRGRMYLDEKNLPEAEEDFRAVLALRPGNQTALQGLFKLYKIKGEQAMAAQKFDEATAAFKAWADLSTDPRPAQAALKRLNEAIYQAVIDQHRAEAKVAISGEDWAAAVQNLNVLSDLDVDNVDLQMMAAYARGRLALQRGDYHTAEESLRPVVAHNPNFHGDAARWHVSAQRGARGWPLATVDWGSLSWDWLLFVGVFLAGIAIGGAVMGWRGADDAQVAAVTGTPTAVSLVPSAAVTTTVTPAASVTGTSTVTVTASATSTAVPFTPTSEPTGAGSAVTATATAPQPTVTAQPFPTPTPIPPTPTLPPTPTATPVPPPTATTVPTAVADDAPAAVILRPADGMPMSFIPGGTFEMGAVETEADSEADERPVHPVTLDGFYIDQWEVTIEQYAEFLQARGNHTNCGGFPCAQTRFETAFSRLLWNLSTYDVEDGYEGYPMTIVTWHGANAYCRRMGGRLPTEAEWEYAARSGGQTAVRRLYPWGDEPPTAERALFGQQSWLALRPVDAFPAGATAQGVLNMAGSVREWTADGYQDDYYVVSPLENPVGPEDFSNRVMRGGSWQDVAGDLRVAARESVNPRIFSNESGVRCVVPMAAVPDMLNTDE